MFTFDSFGGFVLTLGLTFGVLAICVCLFRFCCSVVLRCLVVWVFCGVLLFVLVFACF